MGAAEFIDSKNIFTELNLFSQLQFTSHSTHTHTKLHSNKVTLMAQLQPVTVNLIEL